MFRSVPKAGVFPSRRRPTFQLETLEAREVPTVLVGGKVAPDYAGNTPATARVVSLGDFQPQTLGDYMPSSADQDYYRIVLNKGDFLATNVIPTGAAFNGKLAVLDSNGTTVLAQSKDPTGLGMPIKANPAAGLYAPHDGTFFVRVSSTDTATNNGRSYNLDLERAELQDGALPAQQLATVGAYHAWLNQAGDTLYVSGPSGYGFSLKGNWSETSNGSAVSYSASGKVTLHTTALAGSTGDIALQVGKSFVVNTTTSDWVQLGELSSVNGSFGLSLAPIAGMIEQTFGLDVSAQSLMDGWTIKTGSQIKQAYHGIESPQLGQVLDGVPYLVYGNAGKLNVHFGSVSLSSTDQASLVLIADPSDPFLYVQYGNYAAAGSAHGRIPFNTTVSPTSNAMTGIQIGHQTDYFGHVFAAGNFPLTGLPMNVQGEVTVNLDANGDGQFLGGAGNASQLFHGDLGALQNVVSDINVGVNGTVTLGYTVAGYAVSVPVGEASVFYSGPQQAVFFKGAQGTALNPWAGTVLENFQSGPGASIEGYVFRDGRFSVSTSSNYRLFVADADLTLTVTDHDISATGSLTTPIASASVTGQINFDGSFVWSGTAHVGIGGGGNFISGDAGFVLSGSPAGMTFDLDLNCAAKASIPGIKAEGTLTGHLKMTTDNMGHITYDVASLHFSGSVSVYDPLFQQWNKLGSVSATITLNGNHLTFDAFGYGFSIDLP
ncbi:MAG TPA: hypothetical protein VGJ05_07295 [Fimbriiglobus sp.]|jgi:hypothetical protein